MKQLRLVILCLACAGLLAVPAAADAQNQKPGANQRQSAKCRIATAQQTHAQERIDRATRVIAFNKKEIRKYKKAVKKAKSRKAKKRAKRKLKAAKAELKASREGLETANVNLERAKQRVAGACT